MRALMKRLGAPLAVLALLFQAVLPQVHAQLHRHARTAPLLGIMLPGDASGHTMANAEHGHGPHHECPVCAFIQAFGGAAPPAVATLPAPPQRDGATAGPQVPPIAAASARFDTQPRAPPHRI